MNFFFQNKLRMVTIHGLTFVASSKIINAGFIYCNNPRQGKLSLSFKMCQQLRINGSSLGVEFDCAVPGNPFQAHLQISQILNDVTNTFFADRKTECQLLGCDAVILANDGIRML
jgi:hypothetical protein